jgi:hypothetical protein
MGKWHNTDSNKAAVMDKLIRDIPTATMAILRIKAVHAGVSLTEYTRITLNNEAARDDI